MVRRTTVAVALFTAGLVAVTVPGPAAQQPQTPPVFRTGVDVVQLDVTVLDEHRQPVRGLTAADFTVLDRGEPQPIVSFAAVDLPARLVDAAPWVREIGPDVATNHQDAQRVVVIVMDDCYTPFDPMVSKIAKTIATHTIDLLGPADLTAVVYTASRRQGQEFTTDRVRLRAAVERFTPRGGTPQGHAFSASRPSSGGTGSLAGSGPCSGARSIPQAMQNTAEALRAYPGWRKTLVFISPFTPEFPADSIDASLDASIWTRVFDAMQAANITVYQFDPRGLEVSSGAALALGTLADATGGRTVRLTNAPEAIVPQMFRENSSYYILGIQPQNLVRNGRFRPIDVRVNRPGLTVRTRAGYFAPRDEPPARPSNRPPPSATERAIAGALPGGDVPMSLAVAPVAGSRSRTHAVNVTAGFAPIGLATDGEEVELLVSAFRDDWREMGTATHTLSVTPPRAGGPPHVDVPARLELPPGRYEIRTALRRTRTDQTGSAYASVVVPDFTREPLSLSGVSIERGTDDAAAADADEGTASRATTVRQFTPDDRVTATVSVHQGGRDRLLAVDVDMRVRDTADRARATRRLRLEPVTFGTARAAALRLDVPLTGLEPGEYLVSLTAASSRGAAERHVRLTVR